MKKASQTIVLGYIIQNLKTGEHIVNTHPTRLSDAQFLKSVLDGEHRRVYIGSSIKGIFKCKTIDLDGLDLVESAMIK